MSENTITLTPESCNHANDIQKAIDSLQEGGKVFLPEIDLTIDRAIELRSGVELIGQGEKTVLRKSPSKEYKMIGQHCEGLFEIELEHTNNLEIGMTILIDHDQSMGFEVTMAKIVWIDGNFIGLDRGLARNGSMEINSRLTTAHSLIHGEHLKDVAVRNLCLDGNLPQNPHRINGCRGGAIYFSWSENIEIDHVYESSFNGDGISYQSCYDVRIYNSKFSKNISQGIHPGAGTTKSLIENCEAHQNGNSGFFFCVKANHITIKKSCFSKNLEGITIRNHDCNNLIEECEISHNKRHGIHIHCHLQETPTHSCMIDNCNIFNNEECQVILEHNSYDLIFLNNRISSVSQENNFVMKDQTRNIYQENNEINDHSFSIDQSRFTNLKPEFNCGYINIQKPRHLELVKV